MNKQHMPDKRWGELLADIANWQDEQFVGANEIGALNHLKKEVKELTKTPQDVEEWADAFFMVIQGGRKAIENGVIGARNEDEKFMSSLDIFMYAINKKFRINSREREWGKMAKDGTVEHVREPNA